MKTVSGVAGRGTFQRVADVPCLYRYSSNDVYYALVTQKGRQHRKSLETTDKAIAKRKLADFQRDLGKIDVSQGRLTLRTQRLFAEINAVLSEREAFLREGTIVDATIIAAAPSTKKAKERDPEMHQTKKGNAWHFGMKAHVGVDLGTGLVHTVVSTAANVSDVSQAHRLLHGEEKVRLGDAGYQGVEKRPEMLARFGHLPWIMAATRGDGPKK